MSDPEKSAATPAARHPSSSATAASNEKTPETSAKPAATNSPNGLWSKIPPWITINVQSPKSRKVLLRCWLASWVAFLIILPDASLKTIGNAAFFGVLASFMCPPNVPVPIFLFIIATIVVGMCTGWGIGALAMKAALAARDQTVLKESLLRAEQSLAGATNPDAEFEMEIFQGNFLDARSTVVYGVFLAAGSFFFGWIRAYVPKFTITSVFGSIVLDIFCSFGPLFPISNYTIVSSFLIAVACYTGISLVLITFVFPESLNHAFLSGIQGLLGRLGSFVAIQEEILSMEPEQIANDEGGIIAKATALQGGIIAVQQGLMAQSGLLNAEFSWGRWSGDDAKGMQQPMRLIVARICALQTFTKMIKHTVTTDSTASSRNTSHSALSSGTTSGSDSAIFSTNDGPGDTLLIRQLWTSTRVLEEEYGLRPGDLIPVLKECTRDLRQACVGGLGAARSVIEKVNTRRWWGNEKSKGGTGGVMEEKAGEFVDVDVDQETQLNVAIERLRTEIQSFKTHKRLAIVHPFIPAISAFEKHAHKKSKDLPLRMLIQCSVYCAALVTASNSILTLLLKIQKATRKRKRSRLWAPKGLRAVGKILLGRSWGDRSAEAILGEGERPDVDEVERDEEKVYQRDPDSRPPTNMMQKTFDTLHRAYLWLKTPEAIFCVKYVIVTIALWLPAVFPSSAYFDYTEKGVWAIIMAQTTLNVYISDQIYNYFARLLGTFLGLIVGLLIWYIGNAKSEGNPYGSAATFGVFLVPMVFVRIFAPPQYIITILMFAATTSLIVGYSWIDGHLFTFGNPGLGWSIAWRRWVLVVIGCVASFIVMLFTPTSGRKAVRYRNAAIITELSSLYASLMSNWIASEKGVIVTSGSVEEQPDTDGDDNDSFTKAHESPAWLAGFRERLISLAAQIQALRMQTAVAKWEGNIRGAWPIEEYMKLVNTESDMLSAVAQLAGALTHLDPSWRVSLNRRTKILNPNFISDAMSIFALVSQSLRTGEALHQVLPTSLLDRYLYHNEHSSKSRQQQRFDEDDKEEGRSEEDDPFSGMYSKCIQSIDYMYFATGIAAVSQIISDLDELHRITKGLCGEVPFKGFNEWRTEYERQNVNV